MKKCLNWLLGLLPARPRCPKCTSGYISLPAYCTGAQCYHLRQGYLNANNDHLYQTCSSCGYTLTRICGDRTPPLSDARNTSRVAIFHARNSKLRKNAR